MDFKDFKIDSLVFNAKRRIIMMFKFALDKIQDIKVEHDVAQNKLRASLEEIEFFLSDKYNIDIELQHLAKHVDYLDEQRLADYRKEILDYGNNLKREMEQGNNE